MCRLQNIVRFVTGKLEKWNEVIDSFAKGVTAGNEIVCNGGGVYAKSLN